MISEGITYYIYNYTDKCALRYLLVLPILDYLVPSTALPLFFTEKFFNARNTNKL